MIHRNLGSSAVVGLALAAALASCAKLNDATEGDPGALSIGQFRCAQCHGSAANPAPPISTRGATSTTDVTVGAHQLHLRDTPIRAAVACSECHVVPTGQEPTWHFGDAHATVTWGPLATARGAAPTWDRDARTCANIYCHGAKMRAPPTSAPIWTYAAEPALAPPSPGVCGGCHGYPPPAPHPQLAACSACHPATVTADGAIDVAGGKHVNGRLDVRFGEGGLTCDLCHGFPPEGPGHAVHAGAAGDPAKGVYGATTVLQDLFPGATPLGAPDRYAFGCGNCHPIDDARHMDGTLDVELWSGSAPAGSLKARASAAATYSEGRCSGTYCHSSGQETPAFATSPAWNTAAGLGCAGCHSNPPRHPSGAPGSPTANSHLALASDGYESGHFGGFPSAWHAGTHGQADGQGGAAVTCQTCHFDTVDPRNTGPSGFYYLDTTGDYRLPTGLLQYDCGACHSASGVAPAGAGRVLPLRHVNGTRDVAFDARTTLPPYAALPPAPNTPARPYWRASAGLGPPFPAGMAYDGTTLSVELSAATYTPATKTCSNVACHLRQTAVQWGAPGVGGAAVCSMCHVF